MLSDDFSCSSPWDEDDQPITLAESKVVTSGTVTRFPESITNFQEAIDAFDIYRSEIPVEVLLPEPDSPEFLVEVEIDSFIDTDPATAAEFDTMVSEISRLNVKDITVGNVRSKMKKRFPHLVSNVTISRAFLTMELNGYGKVTQRNNTLRFIFSIAK